MKLILVFTLTGWLFDISGGYELSFYVTGSAQALGGAIILSVPVWRKLRASSNKESPRAQVNGDDKCSVNV